MGSVSGPMQPRNADEELGSVQPPYDNVPVITVDLTEWDQWWLLNALYNDYLIQYRNSRRAGFIGSEQFNEHELDTLAMFEHACDLVRKLGGDVNESSFRASGGQR